MEINKIYSKNLKREITYSYKKSKNSSDYLYFFDGHNLYDEKESAYGHSWHLDKVLEDLKIDINVVGIYSLESMERVEEYLPFPIENKGEFEYLKDREFISKGVETGRFIVEELIPEIEDEEPNFRLIGGSSMGGVMALFMGSTYPTIFKKVLAMSTSPFFAPIGLSECCGKYKKGNNQRVYLDVGTKEDQNETISKGYMTMNRMLYGTLKANTTVKYLEAKDHIHNEDYWNKRLPEALRFLLEIKTSNIRNAQLKDLEEIYNIETSAFEESDKESKSLYKWRIEMENDWFFVYEEDDILGMLFGRLSDVDYIEDRLYTDTKIESKNYLALLSLAIKFDSIGLGISSKLINHIIQKAKDENIKEIILACKEHLIEYYKHYGFELVGNSKSKHGGNTWYDMKRKP